MIPRHAQATLEQLAASFPVVAVTGPRQSGKSTLVRALFADRPYTSLEDPDQREFATDDPRGFLAQFPGGAVLDEIQRCPALFSYLQGRVDQSGRLGEWILTGSQQFGMVSAVTQSLAGRVGMLALLPFARDELLAAQQLPEQLNEALGRGGYPPIYDRPVEPALWYGSYVQTYLERDVRQLLGVTPLQSLLLARSVRARGRSRDRTRRSPAAGRRAEDPLGQHQPGPGYRLLPAGQRRGGIVFFPLGST
ncbi:MULTISPECIES: ATP-binding protein [unclassified Halorhodospira]|uniref:ATP-binding protein n=1 Tax=unclassified Halorhodospira TaxID=2626748 RepID=UPI001EE92C58|nr:MULTISPECIES: AAA family ATPase [unclassified Halorhodospira]MCG5541808.1 AAA family ATPase [Halorhodospira sp. M39old]MCG5546886.1 AAA family ATPase [Halorhodospira sp. M38]